jgi:hypothetical protein
MKYNVECTETFCPLYTSDGGRIQPFNNAFTEFLFAFLLIGAGTLFSAFVVAVFVSTKPTEIESESEEEDENENYEYKYTDVFENLDLKEITPLSVEDKINMKKNVITETTPNGNVVMTYHFNVKEPDGSAFQYYCNDRSIPYKYLDTVARKYVITYNCPELYLYLKTEMIKVVEKNKLEEEKEKEELNKKEDEKKKLDTVFATFKNYKVDDPKEKKKNNRRALLIGKNRYTRLGNIEDYEISLLPKKEVDVKQISFAEFKQRMMAN